MHINSLRCCESSGNGSWILAWDIPSSLLLYSIVSTHVIFPLFFTSLSFSSSYKPCQYHPFCQGHFLSNYILCQIFTISHCSVNCSRNKKILHCIHKKSLHSILRWNLTAPIDGISFLFFYFAPLGFSGFLLFVTGWKDTWRMRVYAL